MITSRIERLLPFSQQHLYALIIDVESYPTFIPWCQSCAITDRFEDGSMKAQMMVGFDRIAAHYSSYVTCVPKTQVHVTGEGDLFQHLETLWVLKALGSHMTRVTFDVTFSFKSPLLHSLAKGTFEKVTGTIMDAFETRARHLSSSL